MNVKNLFRVFVTAAALTSASVASAIPAYTLYGDQTSFLNSVTNAKTDTWANSTFEVVSNAAAKANSAGKVGYTSTGFTNWNITDYIYGGYFCWGCNGSGYMDLTGTNVGTADGVFGFSTNLYRDSDYNAYVTFGDNTILSLTNLNTGSFIGLTSDSLIKKVEFAHSIGQSSTDGVVAFSQVTVAAKNAEVPEPAMIALMGLGLLGFAATRRHKQ